MFKILTLSPHIKLVLDNLLNGAYCVDTKRRITYWNRAASEISGYNPGEVLGKSCKDDILVHAKGMDILCDHHCPLTSTMCNSEPVTVSVRMKHKSGYRVPTTVRCLPLVSEENVLEGAIEIFAETYVDKDVAARLKELGDFAYLDTLTGIPNRRYITTTLDDALHAYYCKSHDFSIVMCDIDFFKRVNDNFGHDVGDIVLQEIAKLLRANLRTLDIVSRWGGEEFLIVLHDMKACNMEEKLEYLRKAVESHVTETPQGPVSVTMSFGCASPREGDTVETLVKRADEWLYLSKANGRNRITSDGHLHEACLLDLENAMTY